MRRSLLVVTVAFLLCGCASNKENKTGFFAMDTYMSLTSYGSESEEANRKAQEEILRLDALLNVNDEGSEIYRLNYSNQAVLDDTACELIKKAVDISIDTDGAFDICVKPLVQAWGFYDNSLHIPDDATIEALNRLCDSSKIVINDNTVTLSQDQQIDLGGIAKGYATYRVLQIYEDYNIKSALINLGGNIYALGKKTDGSLWNIGIGMPDAYSTETLCYVKICDKCVITSGAYERFFTGEDGTVYGHILDPHTGYPADTDIKSVSIISSDATVADALSTALFVMGLDGAYEYYKKHSEEFDMIIYTTDDKLYATQGVADYTVFNGKINILSK